MPIAAQSLPPPPAVLEEYRVVVPEWRIETRTDQTATPSDNPSAIDSWVVVSHNKRNYRWPIRNEFINRTFKHEVTAHGASSDLALVREHIQSISDSQGTGPLILKLASTERSSPLFVMSLKVFDVEDSYNKADKLGSPILNMDADEVKRLGLSKYRAQIEKVSAESWREIERRGR